MAVSDKAKTFFERLLSGAVISGLYQLKVDSIRVRAGVGT